MPSLALAVLLLVMGVVLAVDASGIEAPRGGGSVGPAAFPWAVAGVLLVLGVVLGAVSLRGRPDQPADPADAGVQELWPEAARRSADAPDDEPVAEPVPVGEERPPLLRVRPAVRVAVFAAGLIAHALLVNTAGYVVAALVLFVAVALAFGAPRLVRVVLVGLVLTLVIFYAFTVGLGLALPDLGGR
ncbi:tripartite tricarboxylate transporter TctB family protein [uncultured Modestobacter sp.]|uniref:tripartite tricarboxylate transporter TctB family protein n=1 Tax=uncultured Modestobacter sp. TaxID=380048 RepID=UPI0026037738|nr:tripartite tricarboxylate transporter TctB family protein [uncultured Modestobacter sp.]